MPLRDQQDRRVRGARDTAGPLKDSEGAAARKSSGEDGDGERLPHEVITDTDCDRSMIATGASQAKGCQLQDCCAERLQGEAPSTASLSNSMLTL